MELKEYLVILRRRWYFVVVVPLLVLAGVIYQASQATTSYTATVRMAVARTPDVPPPQDNVFRYDQYYAYLASEYLIDDLVEVVRGNVFAGDVSRMLMASDGIEVSPGEIQGALASERINRILTIRITSGDPNRAVAIAQAAAATLEEKAGSYFNFPNASDIVSVTPVQVPDYAVANSQRQQLMLALQVIVGLFAGVVIAFLVDYLDDTLRSPETVSAALGLPVIGTIPEGKGGR
ncbi:hypothetical protein [Sphaerobacter sp.]|uniref:YveK family protein n=1 Tax=Sphaerobacter sp. TaxID=2099654 RepID=UPI001DE86E0C|nr:hypothetical protein [Sphaerobacter sp.]MBX5445141.1 lipopolysaccharide biosynthesis protein [Sphaerobacter sp.]